MEVTKEHFLSVHPDLGLTRVNKQDSFLIMLGYILDPYRPSDDDNQILEGIIQKIKCADDVFANIAGKCGRFVIIAVIGKEIRIFSDAGGMRQVFYCRDSHGHLWCASQPGIIAEKLNRRLDQDRYNDLKRTELFSSDELYWYPGGLTLFDGISHLTPNHYLDLRRSWPVRYWPRTRLTEISGSKCVEKASFLLRGIFESAAIRFDRLAFAISGGLDSRLLLAASKSHAGKINYFTHELSGDRKRKSPDLMIPIALTEKLGLKHHAVVQAEKMDDDFEAMLRKNVFTAHDFTGTLAFSLYRHFDLDSTRQMVVIYGNASEITKRDRHRWPEIPKFMITGAGLTEMANMSGSKFALKEFSKWLDSVKWVTNYNVNILDLMHWEQRVGNWLSMVLSEYDMAFESLCPYNCLEYIEYMLRVPFKFRTPPAYSLHHELIHNLWPDTLQIAINPEKNKMKKKITDILYATNTYDFFKYAYMMGYRRLATAARSAVGGKETNCRPTFYPEVPVLHSKQENVL